MHPQTNKKIMRKERFIIIMAMLFFSITSVVALEIQMSCRPISTTTNGPRRLPSNNNVTLTAHYNEFSGELHFAYSVPSTFFTYYVYDEYGEVVTFGCDSFGINGCWKKNIGSLITGDYTVNVVIGSSVYIGIYTIL